MWRTRQDDTGVRSTHRDATTTMRLENVATVWRRSSTWTFQRIRESRSVSASTRVGASVSAVTQQEGQGAELAPDAIHTRPTVNPPRAGDDYAPDPPFERGSIVGFTGQHQQYSCSPVWYPRCAGKARPSSSTDLGLLGCTVGGGKRP